ncbi:MAG: hypothetical protein ACKV19_21305 [Verrucomicrobiales bacterium]
MMNSCFPPSGGWTWLPVGTLSRVVGALVGWAGLGGALTGMAAPGDLDA